MRKPARSRALFPPDDHFAAGKPRQKVPYEFVLDRLVAASPWTRPMFGCLAVYVGEKIVLLLRDKSTRPCDNGVWLATTEEHHESLRREFPCLRSIELGRKPVTGWQVIPADAPDFEEAALGACELVMRGDPRIGKVPRSRQALGLKRSTKYGEP
ncbi:MAG TPA: hypothetical protein VEJ67_03195 [Candidatus Cybelea sp.]|nr:hypothetical protein [Candidatus Cybelea sp.]